MYRVEDNVKDGEELHCTAWSIMYRVKDNVQGEG